MSPTHTVRRSLVLLAATFTLLNGQAESITLIPVADTSLFQIGPDNNMGANLSGVIGTTESGAPGRMLLRFDLESKIPTNAIVKSVSLTLHSTKVRNSSAVTVSAHRMLLGWTEGSGGKESPTGAGEAAVTGETTWKDRINPNTPWSVPGAAAPSDFADVASGTATATGLGAFTFDSTPILLSDVTRWIQNPASNFGWILFAAGEPANGSAKRIGTRENPGQEPVLTVEFEVPKPVESLTVKLPPSADTYLFEQKPDNNFGAATQLRVGTTAQSKRARALLRFDLQSVLPPNAVITNASLSITLTKAPGNGGTPSRLELHSMVRPWNEGTQSDAVAASGEPSWFLNGSPDSFWGAPGGLPEVDFSSVILSSTEVNGPSAYIFPSSPALVRELQHWLAFPQDNFGCLLASSLESSPQTARELASRENETGKPELRVGYFLLAPEEIPELIGVRNLEGKVSLQVRVAARVQAVLEYSPSLAPTGWSELSSVVGNATGTAFDVEIPSASESGFYRLRASGRTQP